MDLIETIALPDDDQVDRMFQAFYGRAPQHPLTADGAPASDVTEVFKRNMHTPDIAELELRQRLEVVR